MSNPAWQLNWHLKLFGRAACKPLAKDQRADHKLTTIRNDVTCEKCQALVRQQWGELVGNHPERTEEQIISTPEPPPNPEPRIHPHYCVCRDCKRSRSKRASRIKSQMPETEPDLIELARKTLNMA